MHWKSAQASDSHTFVSHIELKMGFVQLVICAVSQYSWFPKTTLGQPLRIWPCFASLKVLQTVKNAIRNLPLDENLSLFWILSPRVKLEVSAQDLSSRICYHSSRLGCFPKFCVACDVEPESFKAWCVNVLVLTCTSSLHALRIMENRPDV